GYYHSFTLENREKIIPKGKYEFELYDSPNNNRIVPLLKNVPNRSYIEIHIANEYDELLGCIAPGNIKTDSMILESKKAFDSLMLKIRDIPKSEYFVNI